MSAHVERAGWARPLFSRGRRWHYFNAGIRQSVCHRAWNASDLRHPSLSFGKCGTCALMVAKRAREGRL